MIVTWKVHPEQYSKECGGVADTADNDSDDDDDDSLIIICFIYSICFPFFDRCWSLRSQTPTDDRPTD